MQGKFIDPLKFGELLWPDITFYNKQKEIIYSVVENDETMVPAANMTGKDFVAAFIALWFFMSRHPCRVITTSVDGTQLEAVLWGEIRRFIQSSKPPLDSSRGGPIVVNHLHLRKIYNNNISGLSYMIGRVAAKGEGMLGHHIAKTGDGIPRTLFIADEASGVDDVSYERADTWADRKLVIGNPYPCTNFFFRGVRAGDQPAANNGHLYRKVIKIKGADSPNVRFAEAQQRGGKKPTNEIIIPGVLSYQDYEKRRALWDKVRQCIGLDAEFYEGAETLLYPPEWLNRAELMASDMNGARRTGWTIGVDPAEGGDSSCWSVVDRHGLIKLVRLKTPDTTVVTHQTLALMREFRVEPHNVLIDRGGGGKEHADRLRSQGYPVRTVAFGEAPSSPTRWNRMTKQGSQRRAEVESRYTYKNRRAEMYGILRQKLDPVNESGFSIPAEYTELRRQMSVIPLMYDEEGRLELPPKNKRDPNSNKVTMTELLSCSPDELDSLVLAVFGTVDTAQPITVGAI